MKIVSRNTFFEQACFLNCGSDEGYRTGPTGCIVTCIPRKADTPETRTAALSQLNRSLKIRLPNIRILISGCQQALNFYYCEQLHDELRELGSTYRRASNQSSVYKRSQDR